MTHRLTARTIADSCINRFLLEHGTEIDTLDAEAQLRIGDRVRVWRQRLEDILSDHLDEHNGQLEESHVPDLIASVGVP